MEKENNKKNIVVIVAIILVVLVAVVLLLLGKSDNDKDMAVGTYEYESQQLKAFKEGVNKKTDECNTFGYSKEQCAYSVGSWVNDNRSSYNSNSVDLAALELDSILNSSFGSVTDLIDSVGSVFGDFDIEGAIGGLLGGGSSSASQIITMKSNTACQSVSDSKFCVNKLSANVYVHDANSSKWVVLVHPFMTSGSLIYNSLGEMYKEQGYNVLAPDLRGFGSSDGSVAMGYLESLDVYDWIKDLNANWKDSSRYGTTVAPDTIIVHGISLGGATTLQLATNPDMAAANGKEPYTKTLTQLNVKGFIDDCGYTSMSGIITGMFSMGGSGTNPLSSLLGNLGIEDVDFMAELQKLLKQVGIKGFDFNIPMGDSSSVTDVYETLTDFTEQTGFLEDALNGSMNIGGTGTGTSVIPGVGTGTGTDYKDNPFLNGTYDLGSMDFGSLKDKYGSSYEIPSKEDITSGIDKYKGYLDKYTSGSGFGSGFGSGSGNTSFPFFPTNTTTEATVTPVNNSLLGGDSNFLDGLIGTVLMNLIGVGLTEDNYAKYSDVFSSGRSFPKGAKVGIIHGNADTTVPFSNADTVAANVSPATLVKKWEVDGAPHAFVIIGTKTNEYKDYVAKFTDCVENSSCRSIG